MTAEFVLKIWAEWRRNALWHKINHYRSPRELHWEVMGFAKLVGEAGEGGSDGRGATLSGREGWKRRGTCRTPRLIDFWAATGHDRVNPEKTNFELRRLRDLSRARGCVSGQSASQWAFSDEKSHSYKKCTYSRTTCMLLHMQACTYSHPDTRTCCVMTGSVFHGVYCAAQEPSARDICQHSWFLTMCLWSCLPNETLWNIYHRTQNKLNNVLQKSTASWEPKLSGNHLMWLK